uniref:Rhodanese domain-containing protein n=1 Tax=mine drainage metagenome TaxID=410659 RepID=E6QM38_9ZZZZ
MLIFGWVLLEQAGFPLPATPVLLAAGALSVTEHIRFSVALLAGVAACMLADVTWFFLGKRYGHHLLRLLCRFSLEATTCVRRTHESFGRRGAYTLLFAKFVPGLSIVAPPVAGQTGMRFRRFLVFDAIGATIWVGTLLLGGRLFGDLLMRDPSALNLIGRFAGGLLLAGILLFFASRLYRRESLLRRLRTARLEPQTLKSMLDRGEAVYIVDLRHPLELVPDPFTLPGALHLSPEELSLRSGEIPLDRDIVLYCTCPSEATAAKTAMTLHKLGIDRVRPLRGGYDEWKRLGYPLQQIELVAGAAVMR